jgi:DNA polymerase-4
MHKTVIICVDMDAFFASVEQRTDPRLRGRPVAVAGPGGRTVVTTASYEARKLGVKTGMSMWEARKTCPRLVVVVANNARYAHTCRELTRLYGSFTPDMEVYSVDEAFMDVTTTHHLFGGPREIGKRIKKAVRGLFGINCTVGIGPNILMAKLASNLGKPDGLRWIRKRDIQGVLETLPVGELWGIGSRTSGRLASLGIRTCGQLGRTPASLLRNRFGIYGETLKAMGLGMCQRPVNPEPGDAKSVGHSFTLPEDISDRGLIRAHILRLSDMVGTRARRYGYTGRRVSLALRYSDLDMISRQTTLSRHTDDTHVIYRSALGILDSFRLRTRVRLLGVCLSSLTRDHGQIPLIPEERKRREVLRAMDAVNERHGERSITWASYGLKSCRGRAISPAWRPWGVKNSETG